MAETGAQTQSPRGGRDTFTPAQWYCALGGGALLLAGILGWIASTSFDTGDGVGTGDNLILFEVNGWHNLIHLLSGILLLAAFRQRTAAKTVALAFGVVYGVVTVIGLIDGSDVLGLIPVNPADNVLHIGLSLAGILAALVSPRDERVRTSTAPATGGTATTTTDPLTGRTETGGDVGDQRFDRELDPRNAGEQPTNR